MNENVKLIQAILIDMPVAEDTLIRRCEQKRWGKQIISPFAVDSEVQTVVKNEYRCTKTGRLFTVRTGTILEGSIPLRLWIAASTAFSEAITTPTPTELAQGLLIPYSTAYYMHDKLTSAIPEKEGVIVKVNKTKTTNRKRSGIKPSHYKITNILT